MKPLFDLIRRLKGKPLTQAEVDEINDALESAARPDAPSEPELPITPHRVSAEGVALIKRFEGCHRKLPSGMIAAYPDPGTGGRPWTIGWGSTKGRDGRPIPRDARMTQAQVDDLFVRDLKSYADEVAKALGSALPRTSQAQFDALCSWHYNTGAIFRATLTAKHKAGDYAGAAREFGRWNRAGGQVLAGLTRRRAAEAAMYRSGT